MDCKDATALITGAASGIGGVTAAALAAAGCRVVGIDLAAAIERSTPNAPAGVELVAGDVTSEEDVLSAIDTARRSGGPLRIVVNCAGVLTAGRILGKNGPHDLERFRRTVDVNLVGTFNVMRLAAAAIAGADPDENGQRGVVVNTSSIAAFEGQVGQAAYTASKAGVAGLTLCAARDLASVGIRVNAIAPGAVDTPMLASVNEERRAQLAAAIPFPQRLARPDEFAQLVLAIVANDYLNGETIRLDGAMRMAPQ